MNPIRLPRVAAKLKSFAEVVTKSHDRAIEIRQDETGATITAADGHQLCRIFAPPPAGTTPGKVEPFLVDARSFSKAAAEVGCSRTEALATTDPKEVDAKDRPLVVVRVDEKTVGIAGPDGSPQTTAVAPGRMPDSARIIDRILDEAIAGGTKAVARLDPTFLQNVADAAVAMGLREIELTFSPKLNFIAAQGTGPDGCLAQFAIAGIGEVNFDEIATRERPAWERDEDLIFEMPEPKSRKTTTRRIKPQTLPLPMDDIPF